LRRGNDREVIRRHREAVPGAQKSEGATTMDSASEVSVTLDRGLFDRLRAEARRLGVPLEWVVASLVVDTIEAGRPEPALA